MNKPQDLMRSLKLPGFIRNRYDIEKVITWAMVGVVCWLVAVGIGLVVMWFSWME